MAVDVFSAAGYKGRMVQLGGHQIAEIFYDGSWHYFDADIFGGGEAVRDAKGNIPSVDELSRNPLLLDSLASNMELGNDGYPLLDTVYPSWYYFSSSAYAESKADKIVYYKAGDKKTVSDDEDDEYYGWMSLKTGKDAERKLSALMKEHLPSPPLYRDVYLYEKTDGARWLHVEWFQSKDLDNDLAGYKVYVGKTSRGWNYPVVRPQRRKYEGNDQKPGFKGTMLMQYMFFDSLVADTEGWAPEMYGNMFKEPPHDAALMDTKRVYVDIPLGDADIAQKYFYITVMPYDAHGLSVGRRLFPMSYEIKVKTYGGAM